MSDYFDIEKLERIQEDQAVRPPKIEGLTGPTEAIKELGESLIFAEWSKAMSERFTRQYLNTNFLQYAWKNGTTYRHYPISWMKTLSTTKSSDVDGMEVQGKKMYQLDKDTPDHIYLAAFCYYQIPIYTFHLAPEKRVTRQCEKALGKVVENPLEKVVEKAVELCYTTTDWLLRVGDGQNFINSSLHQIWGIYEKSPLGKNFVQNVKPGDRLWFVKGESCGKLCGVATYRSHNKRILGPLFAQTLTNEEIGWVLGETGTNWDVEVHYVDLYDLDKCDLLTHIKGPATIRKYDEKCRVNLPVEYSNITLYSKVRCVTK